MAEKIVVDLKIHDVVSGNDSHLEALLRMMQDLFPHLVKFMPVIRERAAQPAHADPRFVAHQWLVEIDDQPAGLCLFDYNIARACGMLLFIAIYPEYREISVAAYQRLAPLLIARSLEQVNADAHRLGQPVPVGMVLEVETPRLVERYRHYGLVELSVPYHEPILPAACTKYSDMVKLEETGFEQVHLLVYPNPDRRAALAFPDVQRSLALAYLVDFYNLPDSSWVVRQVCAWQRD